MTNKKEEEPKSYITASIESNLHAAIMADVRRKIANGEKSSFSKQVQEYKDHVVALEEQVDDLRTELKATKEKITGVN